ncbi:MAG: ATP-binding protein [Planctomycetota bacterium]
MACTWRIRHKMAIGMVLVVAIMGILVAGALKGFQGYRSAMRIVESKMGELEKAVAFKDAVNRLLTHREIPLQAKNLKDALVADVGTKLKQYREALDQTVNQGRSDDNGFRERQQLDACEKAIASFDAALVKDMEPRIGSNYSLDLLDEGAQVRKVINQLLLATDDLISNIKDELMSRVNLSRREQRFSQIILVSTSIAALFFMLGLQRFLYVAVVKPIRLLEQGVSRVAQGDFEHRLIINSGDEIESFANAYNQMASKLHEMYGDLANQVNERSRQLVRSERLAGVGFLAAGVAHEINNPLASIAFCSEALESRLGDLFSPRSANTDPTAEKEIIHKYLKMIQEEAFRCKEITQKLLAFSRGGDRKRDKTDLGEIIQGVLDMVQHVPNSKGKNIVFEPSPYLDAWVNSQEIKQVFLNLVVNALDSMDEGGTVTITAGVKGNMVELSFRDTGCGMSEEILENIFEPFFTRSRTGKGTGLGLSISHRIITQHGGEIEASSAGPDRGSAFLVRLPIREIDSGDTSETLDPREEFLKHQAARAA